jgi:hypothetical protein
VNECKAAAGVSAAVVPAAFSLYVRSIWQDGMKLATFLRTGISGAALALAGCVVAPVGPYPYPYDQGPVVTVAPPPPQVEVVGVAPYPGYVWLGGYWGWVGGRYAWVGGRWAAPRPGYRWYPHRWEPVSGGWRHYPGHWERG